MTGANRLVVGVTPIVVVALVAVAAGADVPVLSLPNGAQAANNKQTTKKGMTRRIGCIYVYLLSIACTFVYDDVR
jgi:hypothetical protein